MRTEEINQSEKHKSLETIQFCGEFIEGLWSDDFETIESYACVAKSTSNDFNLNYFFATWDSEKGQYKYCKY